MKTLKEVYDEIRLTWLDNLFQLLEVIRIFKDLMIDLQIVPIKLFAYFIIQGPDS